MRLWRAECFVCGMSGKVKSKTQPYLENCPTCDALLSVDFMLMDDWLKEQKRINSITYKEEMHEN